MNTHCIHRFVDSARLIHRRAAACFLALTMVALLTVSRASACPVCFGDPESKLTQGAASGVLFMVILTYALLTGVGGIAVFWFVRARRLRVAAGAPPVSTTPDTPGRTMP